MGVIYATVNPEMKCLQTAWTRPPGPCEGYAAVMAAPTRTKVRPSTPRYMEIAALLRDRIVDDQLGPHTLLPSERELAEEQKVSRMTARQALSLLESEGMVYRRPPRGTFVAEPRVRFHIGSFSEEVSRLGMHPDAKLIWAEDQEPTATVRRALDLDSDATVHAFHRLRTVDGVPFALETTYLPAALTPGILDAPAGGSLWATLRDRYDIEPASSTAVLETIVLDDNSSAQLGVRPGSAGTLLTRRTLDTTGRAVEYARDVYRADRTSFEVTETLS
jgi:GntR family transcriptional regulator